MDLKQMVGTNKANKVAKSGSKARWKSALPSQEEQYQLKRLALIREAGKAFSRKGFHNTSMDEVAATLNVTKPALYYYIKTKQEILYECHNYAIDLGEQARQIAWATSDKPLERLQILLKTYIELLTGTFGSHAVLTEPISSLEPAYRAKIVARLREFDQIFQSLLLDAIAEGSIPPIDHRLAIGFFMGAVNNITRWYSPEGRRSGPEIAEAFVNFIVHGLLGAGGKASSKR